MAVQWPNGGTSPIKLLFSRLWPMSVKVDVLLWSCLHLFCTPKHPCLLLCFSLKVYEYNRLSFCIYFHLWNGLILPVNVQRRMLKLCMYIWCIGFWSLCCSMHTLCNIEPAGRSFASAEVWGLLYKSLKHNHKKTWRWRWRWWYWSITVMMPLKSHDWWVRKVVVFMMMMIKIIVKMMFDVNDNDYSEVISVMMMMILSLMMMSKAINASSFLCDCKIKWKPCG